MTFPNLVHDVPLMSCWSCLLAAFRLIYVDYGHAALPPQDLVKPKLVWLCPLLCSAVVMGRETCMWLRECHGPCEGREPCSRCVTPLVPLPSPPHPPCSLQAGAVPQGPQPPDPGMRGRRHGESPGPFVPAVPFAPDLSCVGSSPYRCNPEQGKMCVSCPWSNWWHRILWVPSCTAPGSASLWHVWICSPFGGQSSHWGYWYLLQHPFGALKALSSLSGGQQDPISAPLPSLVL